MNQNLNQEERDQQWMEIFEEWLQSELTAAEWVREREDITYDQFMWNKRRLLPEAGRVGEFLKEDTKWSAISMEIPTSSFDVYINNCRVVVKSGFDQELLQELVEVLKG